METSTSTNTSTSSTRDQELQTAVEHELLWAPEVDAARIGVSVRDGVVTLSGQVTSYLQKIAASKAAFRTRSVEAVANDILVHYPGEEPTDLDLASSARALLDTHESVPSGAVKVEVRDHFAILTGEVAWNFEREAARKAVAHLRGIKGVENRIVLSPRSHADATQTAARIRDAIKRQAAIDASQIRVKATGETVELSGTVSSWAEKHQAELAAWASPHVKHVENRMKIRG